MSSRVLWTYCWFHVDCGVLGVAAGSWWRVLACLGQWGAGGFIAAGWGVVTEVFSMLNINTFFGCGVSMRASQDLGPCPWQTATYLSYLLGGCDFCSL